MNKTTRMGIAKVLRAAKWELWNGNNLSIGKNYKEIFICHAIHAARVSEPYKKSAIQMVERLLGNHTTLEVWMRYYHPHLDTNHTVMMQRTRHAWLDSMIEEFEA